MDSIDKRLTKPHVPLGSHPLYQPGDFLDNAARRFEVRQCLGTGGFGSVYQVRDHILQEDRAIKVLCLGQTQDTNVLLREIKTLQMLAGKPHVVQVFDCGTTSLNQVFFAMALINGSSLRRRIAAKQRHKKAFRPDEIAHIMLGILSGLESVHSEGILHLDLKPENVLFREDEEVILVDFGLAENLNRSQTSASPTRGMTPYYVSPEQLQKQAVDCRSDIYSAGVILYELATGMLPVGRFADVSSSRSDLPPHLDSILHIMLANSPSSRPPSAAALIPEIESLLMPGGRRRQESSQPLSPPKEWMPEEQSRSTTQFQAPSSKSDGVLSLDIINSPHGDLFRTVVSISAVERQHARIPVHIGLVLDISGSMSKPDKYPLLLKGIEAMLTVADDQFYFTIAVFSDKYEVITQRQNGPHLLAGLPQMMRAIDSSTAKFGRQTRLYPCLKEVINQVGDSSIANEELGLVVILSDGQLHDGAETIQLNEELRRLNLEAHCFGFGEDMDRRSIRALFKNVRGGKMQHVTTTANIVGQFRHLVEKLSNLAVGDTHLFVSLPAGALLGDAFQYKPSAARLDGLPPCGPIDIALGSLISGRTHSVAFEWRPPQSDSPSSSILARTTYSLLGENCVLEQSLPIRMLSHNDTSRNEAVDLMFDELASLLFEVTVAQVTRSFDARIERATAEGRDEDYIHKLISDRKEVRKTGRTKNLDRDASITSTW